MVKDWGYRVSFDRKDLPSLQEMARHIRETHDVEMIERFNNNCEQFLKGEDPEFQIKPISISKTDDLVVTTGLQQCINIILGTSATRWSHVRLGGGAGGIPVQISDTSIDNAGGGPFFLPMATYGWSEAKGMKLFFAGIYPQDTNAPFGTSTIGEMGIDNGGTVGSTLLNRENFINNKLTRTFTADLQVYSNVWIFSCVVEFCPVA